MGTNRDPDELAVLTHLQTPSCTARTTCTTTTHAPEAIVTNLADNLTKTAEEHPDRPAMPLDDMVLTYRELQDGARRGASMPAEVTK